MKLTFPPKKFQLGFATLGFLIGLFYFSTVSLSDNSRQNVGTLRDITAKKPAILEFLGKPLLFMNRFTENSIANGDLFMFLLSVPMIFYGIIFWILGIIIWNIYKSRKNEEI